ncbi:MED6-domain-containing protein [Patellaria atrata CBS 101060]|uniref:Mediator of RNA polymerase II transcription subunit 6 n=1 Tax=Patellaria atrata CBS 101060 TaxID=1346257 RepID=A0A9P4S735_9PEZI|nr:MED6-domain-containing protein [Patellaria atrata CBS 101060]
MNNLTMSSDVALDERRWEDPQFLQWAYSVHGGLKADHILLYFSKSPFFDPTSNLQAIISQNPFRDEILLNRNALESRMRAMQGLEYAIVEEPQKLPDGTDNGIWVIRKQERRKRPGLPDEIVVLGSYYILNNAVYQSPSVGDILRMRLLSAELSLQKFFDKATSLPIFSPAQGYSYLPPSKATKSSAANATQSALGSRAGSPIPDNQSQISTQPPKPAPGGKTGGTVYDLRNSLLTSLRYETEYMDENPLVGEPGTFVFKSSHDRVQAEAKAKEAEAKAQAQTTAAVIKQESRNPTPAPLATQISVRKMSAKAGEKGVGVSPTMPGAPGLLGKKRKKSKAPVSPTTPVGEA